MSPESAHGEAQTQIQAWVAQAQRQADDARRLQSAVAALEVTRWSPGREVRVVVDHAGMLRDVEFTPEAFDYDHASLSRILMAALREARARLREDALRVAAASGAGETLARSLGKEYRAAFAGDGEAPDDGGAPGPRR